MSVPGPNPVIISAQQSDVPHGLQNSSKPKPIPLRVRTAVVPSQSGSQGPSGQVLFQVSDNASFIKPGSAFIKCTVTLSGTAGGADTTIHWGNMSRSGDAMISRLVLSSGVQLEAISNYGLMAGVLLTHASNAHYCNNDHRVLTGGHKGDASGWQDVAANAAINQTLNLCIPIQSNLFNSDQAFPLCLLSQPLMVQVDLNSVGVAFSFGEAPVNITYTVSNAQLVYDAVQPESQYIQALRASMAEGQLYSFPFVSCLSVQNAATQGSTTLNQGLGVSSLRAYVAMMQASPAVVNNAKLSIRNGLNNMRTFLDGQQQSSLVLDSVTSQFAQLQKAYGLLSDTLHTAAPAGTPGAYALNGGAYANTSFTPATYESAYYAIGESYTKLHESGFAVSGSAVSQFQVIFDGLANAATLTSMFFHDLILVIDGQGTCNIVR